MFLHPNAIPQNRPARVRTSRIDGDNPHRPIVFAIEPREMVDQLVDRSLRLPYVATKESRMALPLSIALYLPDRYAAGPSDAFIDNHEFCHLNPLPECAMAWPVPIEEPEPR